MNLSRRTIRTPLADIAVLETAGTGLPVLMIHGNSSCKEVFERQFASPDAARYRMIAMDLPGHGQSSDAFDERAYSIAGYAQAALHVLDALDVRQFAVLGWSLGGHVGIELLERHPGLKGLMIIGAPPFTSGFFGMMRSFHVSLDLLLATRGRLSAQEARRFARTCFGAAVEPRFVEAIERTDIRARPLLFRAMMKCEGIDQKKAVERTGVPVAVLNGSQEPFARLDYLADFAYGNLWDGRCHVLPGVGHAPFLEQPDAFNPVLHRFLADIANGFSAAPAGRMNARSA